MTITLFGATGALGTRTIDALLARGVAAGDIRAAGRNADRLQELADRGLDTRRIDLDQPEGLADAVQGAGAVVLISTSEPGKRVPQHQLVIDAASSAKVPHLIYTSLLHADTSELALAGEHLATERLIAASGIPATILRNGWYTENYRGDFDQACGTGVIASSVGDGRVASATRDDYAEAIAAAAAEPAEHAGRTYELTGDTAWSFDEFAATAGEVLGREVRYERRTTDEQLSAFRGFGMDEGTAGFVAGMEAAIRDGALDDTTGDLARLIGRPTTPLRETLQSWV